MLGNCFHLLITEYNKEGVWEEGTYTFSFIEEHNPKKYMQKIYKKWKQSIFKCNLICQKHLIFFYLWNHLTVIGTVERREFESKNFGLSIIWIQVKWKNTRLSTQFLLQALM